MRNTQTNFICTTGISMAKHSKRYLKNKELVDPNLSYALDEALALLEKTANTKFDSSVEVHVKLGIDSKKGNEVVRGVVALPHGTGKAKRVAAFTNSKQNEAKSAGADIVGGADLIAEIKKTGKCDFDIAVATPDIMKDLATGIAKILGPKGLMPSPKNETVAEQIADVILALKKGKANFKNDDHGNVHIGFGKISFGAEKLKENFDAFLVALKSAKPENFKKVFIKGVTVCASMGPGISVQVS